MRVSSVGLLVLCVSLASCAPEPLTPSDPCVPSPCGPNSQCSPINDAPTCRCLQGYTGSPPNCRPECVVSSDCPLSLACINQLWQDPCLGACGTNAECNVLRHNPICSCISQYTGDPFSSCSPIQPLPPSDPCVPSPCGPNSQCSPTPGAPSCQCLQGYTGSPPNCRLECVINKDCPLNLACINQLCQDPCLGACGTNAECSVMQHTPLCSCISEYTGDPYNFCSPIHFLDCVRDIDCPRNLGCLSQKCKDPCAGACGDNAECEVVKQSPLCSCRSQYTGDPYLGCSPIPAERS